jgi:hypothetical protein
MAANPGFVKDLVTPDRVPLIELAKQLDVNVSSLYRWIQRGVRARNGQRVRLVVFKLAGRTHVRREDLEAFIGATNLGTPEPVVGRPVRLTQRRKAEIDRAKMEMVRKGVLVAPAQGETLSTQ